MVSLRVPRACGPLSGLLGYTWACYYVHPLLSALVHSSNLFQKACVTRGAPSASFCLISEYCARPVSIYLLGPHCSCARMRALCCLLRAQRPTLNGGRFGGRRRSRSTAPRHGSGPTCPALGRSPLSVLAPLTPPCRGATERHLGGRRFAEWTPYPTLSAPTVSMPGVRARSGRSKCGAVSGWSVRCDAKLLVLVCKSKPSASGPLGINCVCGSIWFKCLLVTGAGKEVRKGIA